jgi:uncharacterized protein (TIGR02246 family)
MTAPSADQIRATVDAYVAAYKANDRDALLACYSADAEWTDPVGTPTHHGHEGVAAFWDATRAMAESIELRPIHVHVCGTEAALVMEIHTVVGGAGMVLDAVDVFSFDGDGRIASGKAYWELEKARPESA